MTKIKDKQKIEKIEGVAMKAIFDDNHVVWGFADLDQVQKIVEKVDEIINYLNENNN